MKNFAHWAKYQFKWQFKTALSWTVILGLMSALIGWAYKPFSESGYFEMFQELPDYIVKSFTGGNRLAASLGGFLSMEYFSWMGLAFAFFTFVVGARAVAGEIEDGTYDPLVPKPFSRQSFFWGKYVVYAVYALGLVMFNFLFLGIGLKLVNSGLAILTWTKLFVLTALAVLTFLALSFLLSAVFNSSEMAMKTAIGIGLVQYLVNMIANAVGRPLWAKWTVFHHASTGEIFNKGNLPLGSLLFLGLVWFVFTVAAAVIFERKDISE
ncbi:MAG: ABC transporter permease subunit [Candidatus Acetothermia bacterium]